MPCAWGSSTILTPYPPLMAELGVLVFVFIYLSGHSIKPVTLIQGGPTRLWFQPSGEEGRALSTEYQKRCKLVFFYLNFFCGSPCLRRKPRGLNTAHRVLRGLILFPPLIELR